MMGNDTVLDAGTSVETRTEISLPVGRGGKFLTFFLAEEEYGIEILKVVEIIGLMPITAIPRMPMHIKGVINLRGIIIPVIDLRIKFGMQSIDATEESCIIVVYAGDIKVGVLVDKVSEVLDISDKYIEDTPAFDPSVNTDYILGIGKSENNVKLLLDIDKVLPNSDFETMADDF